jgi:hypothetical protein
MILNTRQVTAMHMCIGGNASLRQYFDCSSRTVDVDEMESSSLTTTGATVPERSVLGSRKCLGASGFGGRLGLELVICERGGSG